MANINIGGRLHSTASGNVVAGANEILDDSKGKKQSVINAETDSALTGKQETISDLSTIRSGAAAGATAYQKPSGGIPASDIASGVIPAISTDIGTDASSDTKAASPKAVKTYVDNEDFETPLTPDGTVIITLSNGDKKTISFNHNHPNYFDKLVGSSFRGTCAGHRIQTRNTHGGGDYRPCPGGDGMSQSLLLHLLHIVHRADHHLACIRNEVERELRDIKRPGNLGIETL